MPKPKLNRRAAKSLSTGSALIAALFLMTIMAIIATAMTQQVRIANGTAELIVHYDQLYLASDLVPLWATRILQKNKRWFSHSSQHANRIKKFPKNLQKLIPGIRVQANIYDLQALFNLNNLDDGLYIPTFIRLVETNAPGFTEKNTERLLSSTIEWITPLDLNTGRSDPAHFYQQLQPPYLAAHQFMQSPSELRLVWGANANILQKLSPLLTALPEKTKINLNTASPALLQSLGKGLNAEEVDEILQARKAHGIVSLESINALLHNFGILPDSVTLKSNYFLVQIKVSDRMLTLNRNIIFKYAGKQPLMKIYDASSL
ncbi:MAG: type II secretion system minor pseudopilin GspK [Legionellaceae bacterium]|nr:type II secretion system minor pseudopilin GspK [Legionellaceae bacterium]